MSEPILLAIIAVATPLVAALTGLYSARISQRNKQEEAGKTRAEGEEVFERVRLMQWEREQAMLARLASLEKDRRDLSDRLEAVEMELHLTKKRYDDDLAAERRKYDAAIQAARKVQESLEGELLSLRKMVNHLTQENQDLHAKMKQLASRVETGELGSGKHKRGQV